MRLNSLLASACLLMAAHQAAAAPVYYTFEGTVNSVQSFGPLAPSLVAGQTVRYIFVADTDLPGTETYNGITREHADRISGGDSYDYFHSDYVGGDAIANDGAGWPSNRARFTFGYDNVISGNGHGSVQGGNSDESGFDYVNVYAMRSFSEWTEGQTGFMGDNSMIDDQGTFIGVYSDLTLIDISDVNPLLLPANAAPIITASGAGTYEIGGAITLGGDVFDIDGDLLHYEWTLDGNAICSGDIAASGAAPEALSGCVASSLALGQHTAVLQVNDGVNVPVVESVVLQVVDTKIPTLAPATNAQILWPPDRRMVDIEILSNAADNGGAVTLSAAVSSNEPQEGPGEGSLELDWDAVTIDPATGIIRLKLRAERLAKGAGRTYSITLTAVDQAGNSSSTVVEVKVPLNQKKN